MCMGARPHEAHPLLQEHVERQEGEEAEIGGHPVSMATLEIVTRRRGRLGMKKTRNPSRRLRVRITTHKQADHVCNHRQELH